MGADIRYQVQDPFHLLAGHKTSGAIGAFVGKDQISFPVILACIAASHLHDHQDQEPEAENTDTNAIKAVRKSERRGDAGEKTWVRKCRRGAAIHCAAALCPHLIVVHKLGDIAACV